MEKEVIQESLNNTDEYFIPDIQDIHIGYEFEIKSTGGEWIKESLTKEEGVYFAAFTKMIEEGRLRVPHLNKKQVEEEGWKINTPEIWKSNKDNNEFYFEKGNYIAYYNSNRILALMIRDPLVEDWSFVDIPCFRGKVKDINTFRYVTKLLEIE